MRAERQTVGCRCSVSPPRAIAPSFRLELAPTPPTASGNIHATVACRIFSATSCAASRFARRSSASCGWHSGAGYANGATKSPEFGEFGGAMKPLCQPSSGSSVRYSASAPSCESHIAVAIALAPPRPAAQRYLGCMSRKCSNQLSWRPSRLAQEIIARPRISCRRLSILT